MQAGKCKSHNRFDDNSQLETWGGGGGKFFFKIKVCAIGVIPQELCLSWCIKVTHVKSFTQMILSIIGNAGSNL